jgi:hypothetical protein
MLIFILFILIFGSLFLVVLYYSGIREILRPNTLEYAAINRTQGKTYNLNDVPFNSIWTKWTIVLIIAVSASITFILMTWRGYTIPLRGILIFGVAGIILVVLWTKLVGLFALREIKLNEDGIIFYNNLFIKTHRGYPRFIRYPRCLVYETNIPRYLLWGWQRELRFTDGVVIYAMIQESSCINYYEDIKHELLARLPNDQISFFSYSLNNNRRVNEFLKKWRNKFTTEP